MNIIPVAEGEIQSIICSVTAKDSIWYDGSFNKDTKDV